MKKIGMIYSDEYLKHITHNHPESPARLKKIIPVIKKSSIWNNIELIEPEYAKEKDILLAHTENHINEIKNAVNSGKKQLDMDTQICKDSFKVALLAAGGVIKAVDTVINSDIKQIFCAVRPPGHHASSDLAMGFCLFNNIAIGARYALKKHNLKRVMIIDWDLHHGNGTQDIFYHDKNVYYISLHQYPHYPGTGDRSEKGKGIGDGFTMNFPMKAGSGDREYMEKFNNEIKNAISSYKPEIIFISAGFDAHESDPLGLIDLKSDSYYKMSKKVKEYACQYSNCRVISVLEGGYDLNALKESLIKHLEGLL